ncbi:hypothetical protein [Streptomyces sp. NPDC056544]|uniref:hypothetical protein n=1 Tax=unclassified Streptomyces TaxID=2593676 RepID=UPI0036B82FCA
MTGPHYLGDCPHRDEPEPTPAAEYKPVRREIKVRELEQELGKAREESRGLRETNQVLIEGNRDLSAANLSLVECVERSINALAAEVRMLWQSVDGLSSRVEEEIRGRKADATSQRSDLGNERHRSVVDVWACFDEFYKQNVRHLVNTLTQGLGDLPRSNRNRRKAVMVHEILFSLFPDAASAAEAGPGSARSHLRELLTPLGDAAEPACAELTAAATKIGATAAALGVTYLWAIDGEWVTRHREQVEPWPGCSLDDSLDLVVSPALVVEGKVIGKATVHTRPQPLQS